MKKRVFIIHGWGGSPEGGCIPWLKKNLEEKGFEVFAPQMPNTEEPKIGAWVSYIAELVGIPDENTFFIGHSIGCQAVMRYLQEVSREVGGAVFIAGWVVLKNLDGEELEIAKPWIETSINFEKLKLISRNYSLVISDNDPFGGFEENKKAFARMNANIIVMTGAGHIENTELPEALNELLKISTK